MGSGLGSSRACPKATPDLPPPAPRSVTPAEQLPALKWSEPDEAGVVAFLCGACRWQQPQRQRQRQRQRQQSSWLQEATLQGAARAGSVCLARSPCQPMEQTLACMPSGCACAPGPRAPAGTTSAAPCPLPPCPPGEKSFNEERVKKAVQRARAAKSKASQGRLEQFFGAPVKSPAKGGAAAGEGVGGAQRRGTPAPAAACCLRPVCTPRRALAQARPALACALPLLSAARWLLGCVQAKKRKGVPLAPSTPAKKGRGGGGVGGKKGGVGGKKGGVGGKKGGVGGKKAR
jgi:hypothetical protein